MERSCPFCAKSAEPGWLCADHPGKPWQHDGCGAEGTKCVCNPAAAVFWRRVFKEKPPDEPPTHH